MRIEKAAQRSPKGNEKSCAGSYKFGFNGQEKVNEIAGIGNHNTALYWEYDTRIARRWNIDPKPHIGVSDYSVLGDNPIKNIDPNGDYFFGLIGSTSAQRKATREYAKSTDGDVRNIMSRTNIHVSYSKSSSSTENGETVVRGRRNIYFDADGDRRESSYNHKTLDPMDDYDPNISFTGRVTAGASANFQLKALGVGAAYKEFTVIGVKDNNLEFMSRNGDGERRIFRSYVNGSLFAGTGYEMLTKTDAKGIEQRVESSTVMSVGYGPFSYRVMNEKNLSSGKSQMSHGVSFGGKLSLGLGIDGELYFKFGGFNNSEK